MLGTADYLNLIKSSARQARFELLSLLPTVLSAMARTRIKICGVRDVDMALTAATAGADAIGLVFVQNSPRFVNPDDAYEIMSALPPMTTAIGVFANHSLEAFSDIEECCPTPVTQLHGTEDEKLVKKCGPDVIKAIRFDPETIAKDIERWTAVDEVCALLIDGANPGSGEAINWEALASFLESVSLPIILAGGLTPKNVGAAIELIQPWAVDVSSGVESAPGIKDAELIEAFCKAVRAADHAADKM